MAKSTTRTRAAQDTDRPTINEAAQDTDRPTINEAAQRNDFGGFNWGAAFFGWLVATALASLLTALLSAAGVAVALNKLQDASGSVLQDAATIGIAGGILLLIVLALAYYAGGYVAGRMSRFDGGRQGFGVWVMGIIVTVVLALAGWIFGSSYNLLQQINLPRIPIDEGSLTTGGLITLIAIVVVTLFAAMAGGKVGERYHRKVTDAGLVD
jgi:hypothetical protein